MFNTVAGSNRSFLFVFLSRNEPAKKKPKESPQGFLINNHRGGPPGYKVKPGLLIPLHPVAAAATGGGAGAASAGEQL